jgi:all-trans-retinol 13,14-reductase
MSTVRSSASTEGWSSEAGAIGCDRNVKMKKYDNIVVGSGISGMTLALLLGLNGRSVLLVEKSPRIGGSMARFHRAGVPFDTGFHFTGGFYKNGILHDMLTALGICDLIRPVYIERERDNRFIIEDEEGAYELPTGYQATIAKLKEYFPADAAAIDRYFAMVKDVCLRTVGMDLRNITQSPGLLDEDYVSLDEVLGGLTHNRALKALMAAYAMCYGVKPVEMSFANHSRVSYGMYESMARVEGGGDAFIRAFQQRFADIDIEIACGTYITECVDVQKKMVGRLVLNTGEEVSCDHCIFTIHPHHILSTLPRECLSKAFVDRVSDFEASVGIFAVYGAVDPGASGNGKREEFGPSMLSLFPTADMNRLIDPHYRGDQALVIMRSSEKAGGRLHSVVNACEVCFVETVEQWKHSGLISRPAEYAEFKERRVERVKDRILSIYPEYRDSYKVLDAASPLTFRDYLNSPDGSAYGVKQKVGQYNLFGKLPLRNIYAAGQSSLLPGVIGAMMSAFIVGRSIVGKEDYARFLTQRLGC